MGGQWAAENGANGTREQTEGANRTDSGQAGPLGIALSRRELSSAYPYPADSANIALQPSALPLLWSALPNPLPTPTHFLPITSPLSPFSAPNPRLRSLNSIWPAVWCTGVAKAIICLIFLPPPPTPSSPSLLHNMYWRDSQWITQVYAACKPIHLPEGLLISHDFDSPVEYMKQSIYRQQCYKDAVPMLNTNIGLIMNKFSQSLPMVQSSWKNFTKYDTKGSFAYSVVSIVYSISTLAVITWFLTLFVLTNYTIRPSLLLKMSTFLSSVFLLITVIKSIVVLHDQQRQGFLHGALLLDSINNSVYLNVIDLLVVILLQINQVQIIMRIFLRQTDKRLTFFVGVIASLTSQVIWAVTKFHRFSEEDEAGDILPAFIYLVRIAMSFCYAALISVFLLTKIHYIIANRDIWLLSILTVILIYSPVAFFIADVSNAWVYELSEIFSVVTYVICVVIPWEWCNKINVILRKKEKDGVLGRRFYEDELCELDKYELFVELDPEDNNDNDNNNNDISPDKSSQKSTSNHSKVLTASDSDLNTPILINKDQKSKTSKLFKSLKQAKLVFLDLTDNIIATGLAIPRSVSVSTPSFTGNVHNESAKDIEERMITREAPTQTHTNNELSEQANSNTTENLHNRRRDVFVYSRKEVIIDFSDDDA